MLAILFWKHVGMTCVGAAFAMHTHLLKGGSRNSAGRDVLHLVCAVVPLTAVNLCWTYSLMTTTASHSVALFIMSPPWACLLQWVLLGDRPALHTILASAIALAAAIGILLVSSTESTSSIEEHPGAHTNDLQGDLIALLAGVLVACYTTACSWAKKACPAAPMHLAPPLAAGAVVILTSVWAAVNGTPLGTLLGQGAALPMFAVGIVVTSITETVWDLGPSWAANVLSPAQIGLVLLLELPAGPLYVMLAYGEKPSRLELGLGAMMLLALAVEHVMPQLSRRSDHCADV